VLTLRVLHDHVLGGIRMRRREFITCLGGAAAAWPLTARAQQAGPMRRIAYLVGSANDSLAQGNIAILLRSLASLGWKEGLNIQMEYRFGDGITDRIRSQAAELVKFNPDVILAGGSRVL